MKRLLWASGLAFLALSGCGGMSGMGGSGGSGGMSGCGGSVPASQADVQKAQAEEDARSGKKTTTQQSQNGNQVLSGTPAGQ